MKAIIFILSLATTIAIFALAFINVSQKNDLDAANFDRRRIDLLVSEVASSTRAINALQSERAFFVRIKKK